MIVPDSPWFFIVVFALSALLTGVTYVVIRRLRIVDVPNARSSHNLPTPKGGGVALALVVCTCLFVSSSPALLVLGAAGLILSLVGLVDDVRGLDPLPRFLTQLGVAVAALAFPLAALQATSGVLITGFAAVTALLTVVWLTNLYNFIDGIDGIAALQTILLGAGLYLLDSLGLYPGELAWLALVIACAAAGFMLFNFPPARIFMGDTGSAFVGFVIAGAMMLDASLAPEVLWLWLILLAGFTCDATVTLISRIVQGKPFHQAHRSHVYQLFCSWREQALREQGVAAETARTVAHRTWLLLFGLVFCLFQMPVALLVAAEMLPGIAGFIIVYGTLSALCVYARAGRQGDS
ncbi:MAG: glycosyltransferase family 4 protein [Porticoccaceae bacterium]